MKIVNRIYDYCDINSLSQEIIDSFAECYKEIFNQYWNEKWTKKTAENIIKKGLVAAKERKSSISLLFNNKRVVGFAWIVLADAGSISVDDMPYELTETEKKDGIKTIKYWLNLVSQKKVVIYRELGIYSKFQNLKGEHVASMITIPLVKMAYDDGYKALFYWTNPNNVTFKLGLGCCWYPIHYYVNHDRVIMAGEVKKFIYYLQGALNKDKKILKEMLKNRKNYLQL
ncbi:MAG: hypothetical protein U9M94_02820 [Patescibacteria group bacterium]|nr:hypothetical protein [Patescibacteria group bacterium]